MSATKEKVVKEKNLPSKKGFIFDLIKKDTQAIIKAYRKPLILISVLTGFLLFFLNVFFSVAISGNKFNEDMKDKLGVYVYLRDTASEDQAKVLTIKSELETVGLKVQFSSKDQALGFVEKRVPDLLSTLKKYNIKNPLPATLYIMYKDQSEFELMQTTLAKYQQDILNGDELADNTIRAQEQRVLNVINLSNFVQIFSYAVVVVMLVTILVFVVFFLKTIFDHFISDIQAKKLLGASAYQIVKPFLNISFITLGVAFAIMFILLGVTMIPLDKLILALFGESLFTMLFSLGVDIIAIFVIEAVIVVALMSGTTYLFVKRMHKKLK